MIRIALFSLLLLASPCLRGNPELHVCTVANYNAPLLKNFLSSAKKVGIEVDLLGWGKTYYGHGWALQLYEHYLHSLPDEDLVLFVDSFDVFFLAGREEIVEKFLAMKVPFFISTELNCAPDNDLKESYPEAHNRYRFLNSGTYMGYVGEMKKIFQRFDHPISPFQNDQRIFTLDFLKHPHTYHLDSDCSIAQTLHLLGREDFSVDLTEIRITNLETGTKPCIIHGNGNAPLLPTLFKELFTENPSYTPPRFPMPKPFDDLSLLQKLIELKPDDSVLQVDLADYYFAAKDYSKAFIQYKKLIDLFTNREEINYWIKLQIAKCLIETKSSRVQIQDSLMEAHFADPKHLEPIYYLVNHLRKQGEHQEAYQWLAQIKGVDWNKFGSYYEESIYRWGLCEELALVLYHNGRYLESEEACLNLLRSPLIPMRTTQSALETLQLVYRHISPSLGEFQCQQREKDKIFWPMLP